MNIDRAVHYIRQQMSTISNTCGQFIVFMKQLLLKITIIHLKH